VLSGPSTSPEGYLNLFGGVRRSIAKSGYSDLKEFQRVELVVH
jgi:IMP dehydrogenase